MKVAIAAGLSILCAGSLATADSLIVFSAPSQLEDAYVSDIDWVGHVGSPDVVSRIELEGAAGTWERTAVVVVDYDSGDVDVGAVKIPGAQVEKRAFDTIRIEGENVGRHGFSVQSDAIDIQAKVLQITSVVASGHAIETGPYGHGFVDRIPYPERDSVVLRSGSMTSMNASHRMFVAMAGWEGTVTLDGEQAPLSASATPKSGAPASLDYVYLIELSEGRFEISSSDVEGETIMFGGAPNATAFGRTLLPKVHENPRNIGEPLPNGTLLLDGPVELTNMTVADLARGRIGSQVAGDFAVVRVDGKLVDAGVVPAAIGVGAVAALVATWRGLVGIGLFTRLTPAAALEHPRRQSLHRYIQEHPGATFRELCRATDIPAGTCRHHLSVLDRAQVIVEHRHRATVRFFENHGKFDHKWQEVVMLREPELAKIHGWLGEQEGVIQKDILEHALSSWGWSRSTTQHRLQRLVDNGLVDVQEMGRRKSYSLASDEPEPVRQFGLRV